MVNPLDRRIPGVAGSRPPPQFGLGGFNDAAMALAYGGQTPAQAMQAFQQAEQRFATAPGAAPGTGAARPLTPGNPYMQYGGFNPQAYLAANPDVARHYDENIERIHKHGFWNNPLTGERQRTTNPYDWAYNHWMTAGQREGRGLGL